MSPPRAGSRSTAGSTVRPRPRWLSWASCSRPTRCTPAGRLAITFPASGLGCGNGLGAWYDGHASGPGRRVLPSETADVIVVGAGPAGSSVALRLAQAGLGVLVLEKARFPREKVCGDGLTPRAVKALTGMGIPMAPADGWRRTKGLRMVAGGSRLELSWPELSSYPGYGMVRGRPAFDEILARHAQKAGGDLRE